MANRVIDAILRLNDQFTAPMKSAMNTMTSASKAGISAGKQIEKVGNTIAGVGMGLTAAVTTPLVALGMTSVNTFGTVDKNLRLVQQTMGSSAEEAELLESALKSAATTSIYSMEEASSAVLSFARAGFDAKTSAELISPALSLAAGTATDLSTVTAGLGGAMKVFGLEANEATHLSAVFAKAQAQANTTTTDLFEAISTAGPIFKTVGWQVEDLAAMIDVLGDAGISGSEGANALKSGLARLSGNTQAMKAMDALGISIYEDNGQMKSMQEVIATLQGALGGLTTSEQMYYASKLFGANQMGKWLSIINTSSDTLNTYRNNLNGITEDANNMANALMGGAGGAMETLSSTINVAKYNIGSALANVVTPITKGLTNIISAFNKMDATQQQQIIRWAMIAASIGPVLLIFGKMVALVGKGVMIFNKVGIAVKAAGGLMGFIATPAGIVVAVILALVAAVLIVRTHFDVFKRSLATASPIFASVKAHVQSIIDKFQQMWTVIGPIVSLIGNLLGSVFTAYIGGMVAFVVTKIDTMLAVFDNIMTVCQGVIDFIKGVFTGDWDLAWQGVSEIFSGIVGGIEATFKGVINGLIGSMNAFLGGLNGMSIPDWVPVVGGQTFNIPLIPTLGTGTDDWMGGLVQVHERGGEIIDLPRGSRVYPHDESLDMARREGANASAGSAVTITGNTFNVRSDADIEAIGDAIVRKLRKANENRGGWTYNGVMA